MKFSILLPTRNRLDYLKHAISSVRNQSYENWELIISDNASHEPIEDYISSLNDSRIKYSRSNEVLSVTENWNRSLEPATGDYIIMLGDDDILLKDYFAIALKMINNYQEPDLIYTNAFLYAYPGVLPNYPNGLFHGFGSLVAMPKKDTPFFLDVSLRHKIVQHTLKFEPVYGTNMQHALIHKTLIEKAKKNNQLFYSPYPDAYAMTVFFLIADRVLIYPFEVVVIGITPKSHGYYAYNSKENEGVNFLNIKKEIDAISSIQSIILPGSNLTYWLGAMEMVKTHFSLEKYKLHLDYDLYRQNQIKCVIGNFVGNPQNFLSLYSQLVSLLSDSEKLLVLKILKNHKEYISEYKKLALTLKLPMRFNIIFSDLFMRLLVIAKSLLPKIVKRQIKKLWNSMASPSSKSPKIVMQFENVIENRFANASEIFENILPVDCL